MSITCNIPEEKQRFMQIVKTITIKFFSVDDNHNNLLEIKWKMKIYTKKY